MPVATAALGSALTAVAAETGQHVFGPWLTVEFIAL